MWYFENKNSQAQTRSTAKSEPVTPYRREENVVVPAQPAGRAAVPISGVNPNNRAGISNVDVNNAAVCTCKLNKFDQAIEKDFEDVKR